MPVSARFEKTIQKVAALPEAEQDVLAEIIQREIESEMKWEVLFAQSPDKLSKLGAEALQDFKAGRTVPLDPKKL